MKAFFLGARVGAHTSCLLGQVPSGDKRGHVLRLRGLDLGQQVGEDDADTPPDGLILLLGAGRARL